MSKRTLLTTIATSAALVAGTSAFVAPSASETGRAEIPRVHPSDIALDAARTFELIDVDANGVVDLEEFSAQTLVYAEIVRRDRHLTIEGTKAIAVPVPEEAPDLLTAADRRVLTTNARANFHRYKDSEYGLSRSAWVDWRQARFDNADRDNDGFVDADEALRLAADAAAVAPRS